MKFDTSCLLIVLEFVYVCVFASNTYFLFLVVVLNIYKITNKKVHRISWIV